MGWLILSSVAIWIPDSEAVANLNPVGTFISETVEAVGVGWSCPSCLEHEESHKIAGMSADVMMESLLKIIIKTLFKRLANI